MLPPIAVAQEGVRPEGASGNHFAEGAKEAQLMSGTRSVNLSLLSMNDYAALKNRLPQRAVR